jgi:hypothetical protein
MPLSGVEQGQRAAEGDQDRPERDVARLDVQKQRAQPKCHVKQVGEDRVKLLKQGRAGERLLRRGRGRADIRPGIRRDVGGGGRGGCG